MRRARNEESLHFMPFKGVRHGRALVHARIQKEHLMTAMDTTGSVMIIGGGIAGMQASLDLAGSGYLVHLVEKDSAIGGIMSTLDKTFPTNDCAM
jgi:heterodisulfide reductase subunit A-like polyferredoxin